MGDRTRRLDDPRRGILAEQLGHRWPAGPIRQVGDRCHADDARHFAADAGMAAVALKGVKASGARRQQGQMSTGRFAAHDNRRRIDAETLTIGPHPANRRLYVLDLRRPWCLIHDAILASDADEPTLSHAHPVTVFERSTVGGLPAAPWQKEQALDRARGVRWTKDIDFELTPSNVMDDNIFFNTDVRHRCLL